MLRCCRTAAVKKSADDSHTGSRRGGVTDCRGVRVCARARACGRQREGARGGGDCGFYFGLPVKLCVRVGVRAGVSALVISFINPSRRCLMWVQAGPRAPACWIFSSFVAPLSGSSGSGFLSTFGVPELKQESGEKRSKSNSLMTNAQTSTHACTVAVCCFFY